MHSCNGILTNIKIFPMVPAPPYIATHTVLTGIMLQLDALNTFSSLFSDYVNYQYYIMQITNIQFAYANILHMRIFLGVLKRTRYRSDNFSILNDGAAAHE